MVIAKLSANEQLALGAGGGVNGLAVWTWVSAANDLLQLALTIAGLVVAFVTVRYYRKKTKKLDES